MRNHTTASASALQREEHQQHAAGGGDTPPAPKPPHDGEHVPEHRREPEQVRAPVTVDHQPDRGWPPTPCRCRRSRTTNPAFHPASRYTFEAPGLPDPSLSTSCPVGPGDEAQPPGTSRGGTRPAAGGGWGSWPAQRGPACPLGQSGSISSRIGASANAFDRDGRRPDADLPVPLREVRRAVRGRGSPSTTTRSRSTTATAAAPSPR